MKDRTVECLRTTSARSRMFAACVLAATMLFPSIAYAQFPGDSGSTRLYFRTGYARMSLHAVREYVHEINLVTGSYAPSYTFKVPYPKGTIEYGIEVRWRVGPYRTGLGWVRKKITGLFDATDGVGGSIHAEERVVMNAFYAIWGFDIVKFGPVQFYVLANPSIEYTTLSLPSYIATGQFEGTDAFHGERVFGGFGVEACLGAELVVWRILLFKLETGYHSDSITPVFRSQLGYGLPIETSGFYGNLIVGIYLR